MSLGTLYIISAPSGTGKTTILKPIIAGMGGIDFSVSHTTRAPRDGEVDGKDYHFVDRQSFIDIRDQGGFLEWAEVHGNFYGTSAQTVQEQLAQGRDIILDIDVQGASQIREQGSGEAVFIFIVPPSWEELEERLRGRQTDSEETIRLRLDNARQEMKDADLYDYLVINDQVDDAVRIMEAIILEKRTRGRRAADGSPMKLPALDENR